MDLKKFEDSNVARPSEIEDITKDSVFFLDRSISYWPYKSGGEEKILKVTKKEKIKENSYRDFFKLKTYKRNFLKNIKK